MTPEGGHNSLFGIPVEVVYDQKHDVVISGKIFTSESLF